MKKFYYFVFFFFIQFHGAAQYFQGVLIDSTNQEPIPYVHLLSTSSGTGTLTNENGNFSWEGTEDSITFRISHVGYKPKIVSIARHGFHKIFLTEDRILLNEITITDAGYLLARRAMNGLKGITQYKTGIAFYRQLTTLDNQPNEFIESFHEVSFSRKGIHQQYVYQGRYAQAKGSVENPTFSFQNFSTLTFNFEIFSEVLGSVLKPFTPVSIDQFDFEVEEKFESGGQPYAVVNFNPNEVITTPYLRGQFILNLNTDKIRKFTASTTSSLGTDTIRYGNKTSFGITKNHKHEWVFQFSDTDQIHCLEYIRVSARLDMVDPLGHEHQVKTSSKFIVVRVQNVDQKKLEKHDGDKSDVEAIKNKFDKKFWRRTPVIDRTPEEEAVILFFEKKNSFGNY